MKRDLKIINIKEEYDLCIIGFYAAGGVASYIYQLWKYLNKEGVDTLLVTDFTELNIEPKNDAINVKQGNFELIKTLLKVLEKINLKQVYVVQIDTIPFFLPLIKKYPSFLHIEYWPHELPLAISRLRSIYSHIERELLSNQSQIETCWKELIKDSVNFNSRWSNRMYLKCYWLSLFYADFIGVWIEKDLKIWKSLFLNTIVDTKKLIFLPPMIDTEMFNMNEKDYSEVKILINGKKTYRHNFLKTLETIKKCLSGKEILITGIDSLTKYYEEADTNHLNYLGFVPYDLVPRNYKIANVYVLLSESHEGFSVSTLEAMASGCVSIVSPFVADNMGDVVVNGQTGFIVRNNEELREVLKILYENPNKLEEMGMNARKLVEKRYSFNQNLKYYEFFRRLLRDEIK